MALTQGYHISGKGLLILSIWLYINGTVLGEILILNRSIVESTIGMSRSSHKRVPLQTNQNLTCKKQYVSSCRTSKPDMR